MEQCRSDDSEVEMSASSRRALALRWNHTQRRASATRGYLLVVTFAIAERGEHDMSVAFATVRSVMRHLSRSDFWVIRKKWSM